MRAPVIIHAHKVGTPAPRFAAPSASLTRPAPACRATSVSQRKEKPMIALYDHIQELRAELRGCYFTRSERAAVQAELAQALADQAELDRAFDTALETLKNTETTGVA
jgi:hypothetical protein